MGSTVRNLIILVVVTGLAGFIGFRVGKNQNPPIDPRLEEAQRHYEDLKTKFDQLSQVDIEEYLKLQENKDRYIKSQEILSKLLLIMMNDLGLRRSGNQSEQLKSQMANSPSRPPATSPIIQPSDANRSENKGPVATPPPASWRPEAGSAAKITSENQVADFLKKAEIARLFDELRNANKFTPQNFQDLNGSYVGQVTLDAPDKLPYQVELNVNGRVVDSKYRGRHRIILSRNGKTFSDTRGGVEADSYVTIPGDDGGIIINASNDNTFFHIYYFARLNEFQGNVYNKQSIGEFKKEGIVVLRRR